MSSGTRRVAGERCTKSAGGRAKILQGSCYAFLNNVLYSNPGPCCRKATRRKRPPGHPRRQSTPLQGPARRQQKRAPYRTVETKSASGTCQDKNETQATARSRLKKLLTAFEWNHLGTGAGPAGSAKALINTTFPNLGADARETQLHPDKPVVQALNPRAEN